MTIERTQEYALNVGPQHTSTHGVFRMVVHLDGETVTWIEPKIGYLHRGLEKLAESLTYTQFIPYTDRLDYLSGPHNSLGYVQAVEKLLGLEVPERAEYLRVIFAELGRIASHLFMIASGALDISGWTPWTFCMRERERILDMFEMTAGNRMMTNYFRFGGVRQDLPEEFLPALRSFLDDLPEGIEEYYGIFFGNEIAQARMKSVGILPKELAENLLITGANLRASGVRYDVRKAEPYGIYDRFEFDIPVLYGCDTFDRHFIRLLEIQESRKILYQALKDLPEGPVMAKAPKLIKPPAGRIYHRVENPRGEMGWYVVSNGTTKPERVHIRTGAFVNVQMLNAIIAGWKLQDLITIFASIDIMLGEVDK